MRSVFVLRQKPNERANIRFFLCLLVGLFCSGSLVANASSLPEPEGRVILTIDGRLSKHNGENTARFDRAMLEAIGMRDMTTRTIYSKKASVWSGILMRDLLEYVGAKGEEIEFVALDDYRTTVPMDDFQTFDVLLALKKDGKNLGIRTRGPTRIIYPHDQHEELHDQKYAARYVWQIRTMIVK